MFDVVGHQLLNIVVYQVGGLYHSLPHNILLHISHIYLREAGCVNSGGSGWSLVNAGVVFHSITHQFIQAMIAPPLTAFVNIGLNVQSAVQVL